LTNRQIENSFNDLDTYNKLKWVIEGTHIGKRPCCQAGTLAAEFPPWVQNLVDPEDSTLIKTYYSAFKANQLRAILEEKEIKNIYFAGLLSNMCVLATALYAVRLAKEIRSEWSVYTIVDALAWRNDKSHLKALETMQHEGVRLITSEEVIAINHTT
jgi:nicotinamidase-related amidase